MAKRVLITGTSTGFGRDTAERLARRGDHVFATMRDPSGRNAAHRQAVERLASQEDLRLRVLELDVTDQASVDSGIAAALEEAGGLDAVINNAALLRSESPKRSLRTSSSRSSPSTCTGLFASTVLSSPR